MSPSVRSHSNYNCADTVRHRQALGRPWFAALAAGFAHSLEGSPRAATESSLLALTGLFGTALPPRAAPHPALLQRSCLRLPPTSCLPMGYDFHILSSWT